MLGLVHGLGMHSCDGACDGDCGLGPRDKSNQPIHVSSSNRDDTRLRAMRACATCTSDTPLQWPGRSEMVSPFRSARFRAPPSCDMPCPRKTRRGPPSQGGSAAYRQRERQLAVRPGRPPLLGTASVGDAGLTPGLTGRLPRGRASLRVASAPPPSSTW